MTRIALGDIFPPIPPAAVLGGILLGIIETFAKVINTNISDAVVFAVLIIVLLVKPAGLLGKTVREKV